MSFNYHEYLQTEEWQQKRLKRLKMDNFKCACCGSPANLHVHHLNYDHIGDEDVANDLVTLCRYCHCNIEIEKKNFSGHYYPRKAPKSVIEAFWNDMEPKDKSNGGSLDFCTYDTIAKEWMSWLLLNNMAVYLGKSIPKQDTQAHFRDMRIRKILRLKQRGFSPGQIVKTGISQSMVYKYYNNTDLAKTVLETGLGYTERKGDK